MQDSDQLDSLKHVLTGQVIHLGFTILYGEVGVIWQLRDNFSMDRVCLVNTKRGSTQPLKVLFEDAFVSYVCVIRSCRACALGMVGE